ncbi:MAG: OadG family protein [Candidatus Bruticola sp.]
MSSTRFYEFMIVEGLIITVIGMLVVFCFLAILVCLTSWTSSLVRKYAPEPAAPPAKPASPVAAPKVSAPPAEAADGDKIAAVIAIAQREFGLSVK